MPEKDSLFVRKLAEAGLSDADIAVVLATMSEICEVCWNAERPCYCAPGYDE